MWRGYKNALSLLPIENVAQGRQAARNVAPSASVLRAVVDMVKWRQGSLVVRDGESGPILGTITERDVLERVDPVAGAMRAARVEQIMTPREELATAAPSLALGQCMRLMQPGFRQLPIVDGERVRAAQGWQGRWAGAAARLAARHLGVRGLPRRPLPTTPRSCGDRCTRSFRSATWRCTWPPR